MIMEIAVISGKGGTGKSSISAAFASIEKNVVLADCDVDAANLYLIFAPTIEEEASFTGGQKAKIDYNLCMHCGKCINYCRFDAISFIKSKVVINDVACDGCKLCSRICPVNAISILDSDKSKLYSGSFRNGKMIYGRLAPGEENSGKLVNIVRDKAKEVAKQNNIETIIIDGPPGIGCPVISTITGVDYVVIVTEPTKSGLHDLKRTLEMIDNFKVKSGVIINKSDLNNVISVQIEDFCKDMNIDVIAKLIFNPQVVEAMVNCKSLTEYAPQSDFALEIEKTYRIITNKNGE
jgi:MinD superfamily P-loop ATPase